MSHAKYSPSKFKYFAICPGYQSEEGSNARADEGTMLHKVMETGEGYDPLDEAQKKLIDMCRKYDRKFSAGAEKIFLEKRLKIAGVTFGTTDKVVLKEKATFAEMLDWKFGYNPVDPAETNWQAMCYVCGLFEEFPTLLRVRVHFVLPRLNTADSAIFSRKQLPAMQRKIRSVVAAADRFRETQDASMLCTSEEACQYCSRVCPKLQSLGLEYASKYEALEVVPEVHASLIEDPAEAAKYYTVLRVLEKMVESAKKHITSLAKLNGGLPGWRLAEKAGSRKIEDLPGAYAVLKEYLTPEEIALSSTISIAQCIERIRDKAPLGKKGATEAEVVGKLQEFLGESEPVVFLQKTKEL